MTSNSKYTCALQAYDLWSEPPVQNTVLETITTEHRPVAPLDTFKAIEFDIKTAPDEYIIFSESKLELKVSISLSKLNGDLTYEDWDKISVVNNLQHSLFDQVQLEVSNNRISIESQSYPYKAFIENLLGMDESAKKTHLTGCLWSKDKPDEMDKPNKDRGKYFKPLSAIGNIKNGNVVELISRLHIDLSFQDKAFLGGTPIRIKLIPGKPQFYMMSSDVNIMPTMHFESAVFHVRRARVYDSIVVAHNQALKIKPAQYPMVTGIMKRFILKKDTVDAEMENVVIGTQPLRIFLFMVKNTSYNGSYVHNPYNCELFDICHLAFYRNGQCFPSMPLQPNVERGQTLSGYFSLMDAANQTGTSTYIDINRDEFSKGYGIFGVNFSADSSNGCGVDGHLNHLKTGSTRVQVIFKKPLPCAVTVLMYCEFDTLLQIDKNRNPIVSYHDV